MPYKDPEKRKAYAKKHYEANKAAYKARAKEHSKKQTQKLRQYVWDYLSDNPCVDCGETDPLVLQFDHRSDKKYHIVDMVYNAVGVEKLQSEIDKCDIRCANCHMRKTAKDSGWWKDKVAIDRGMEK